MSNIDRYVKFISEQKFGPMSTDSEKILSDYAFDRLIKAGALHVRTLSNGITYRLKGKGYILPHELDPNGHRYVDSEALGVHLNHLNRLINHRPNN